jgi:hypothetical protein
LDRRQLLPDQVQPAVGLLWLLLVVVDSHVTSWKSSLSMMLLSGSKLGATLEGSATTDGAVHTQQLCQGSGTLKGLQQQVVNASCADQVTD